MSEDKAEQFRDEMASARQAAQHQSATSAAVDIAKDQIKKRATRQILIWVGGVVAAVLPWVLLILFILAIIIGVYNEYIS
ncbi:MAG: hypothetical protein ACKKL5_00670 [Candidatus Komeilibacteria bacterium]